MKEAGSAQVIMACDSRWALMTETPQEPVSLAYLSQQFDRHLTDLVLVEGFKQETHSKDFVASTRDDKTFARIR